MSQVPKSLYRYLSLAGPYGRTNVEDIILRNKLRWSDPTKFNDPFDCNPVFVIEGPEHEIESCVRWILAQDETKNRYQQRQMLQTYRAKGKRECLISRVKREIAGRIGRSRIVCFSGTRESSLMWGHYGDSHKGICLEFDFSETDHSFHQPWKVKYYPERSLINLVNLCNDDAKATLFEQGHNGFTSPSLLEKDEQWKYEEEWRLVAWENSETTRYYPRECLKSIILGCKIGKEDEAFVRSLVDTRPELKLYRATLDDRHYRMKIVEVP